MKNVFIAYISTFGEKTRKREYDTNGLCSRSRISAVQTNEAAFRCFADSTSGKDIRIIKIVSRKAENIRGASEICGGMTADEYFTRAALEFTDDIISVRDYSENNDSKDPAELIAEITRHISADDRVYIDTAGGPRTTANMIQLLTKILRYKGIENPVSYYTNIQNDAAYIEAADYFRELTDIADGINEFANNGKSGQIRAVFENDGNISPEVSALLDEMKKFTDNIQLCFTDELDDDLNRMKKALDTLEAAEAGDTKTVILKELIPVVRNKFFGDSDGGNTDVFRIVKWCIQNGFIQQALTVFTEKMPVYIFGNNILSCSEELFNKYKGDKNPLSASEPYTNIFYTDLFSPKNDVSRNEWDHNYDYFIGRVMSGNPINKTEDAEKTVRAFESVLKKIDSIMKNSRYGRTDPAIKNLAQKASLTDAEKHILDVFVKYNAGESLDAVRLKNRVASNRKAVLEILGTVIPEEDENKTDTISRKIGAVLKMETDENYSADGITINIPLKDLAEICTGYLYVKILRNRINHASDGGRLSPQQKIFLTDRGYSTDFDIDTISRNLDRAAESVKKCRMIADSHTA